MLQAEGKSGIWLGKHERLGRQTLLLVMSQEGRTTEEHFPLKGQKQEEEAKSDRLLSH